MTREFVLANNKGFIGIWNLHNFQIHRQCFQESGRYFTELYLMFILTEVYEWFLDMTAVISILVEFQGYKWVCQGHSLLILWFSSNLMKFVRK